MSAEPKPWVPATITVAGTPGQNYGEPNARILAGRHEGREFPMGWNIGQTFEPGTDGFARYETHGNRGLWRFATELPAGAEVVVGQAHA